MRAFRDVHDRLVDGGAAVLGVSSDSVESHAEFVRDEGLPFRLLSDADGTVRDEYGIPSTFFVIPGRVTFVIGRDRIVREVYQAQFEFEGHAERACEVVDALPPE